MKKKFSLVVAFAALASMVGDVTVASTPDRFADRDLERTRPDLVLQRLEEPIRRQGFTGVRGRARLDPSLIGSQGPQRILIRLQTEAVGEMGDEMASARVNRKLRIEEEQAEFMARCESIVPGARLLARTQLVLNALIVEVDAAALPELVKDPAVYRISRVRDYEIELSETVPHIGAAAVQAMGFDGSDVRVAVLDSGVDYYHAEFGGSGNPADYAADDPTIIEPGTFPTPKVVGGYDFVGSNWFGGPGSPPEMDDPDPLDDGPGAFHGTHVADILGGLSGVAPGVDLYAVKVCSSVSTACSGLALIQGLEFAVDPDGDGDPQDRVDIINMSLGADYGAPFDDDLSTAVDNATALGVLTVAAAGNGGNRPYVSGTPAAAKTALSVAQTQVPSAQLQLLTVDMVDYPAVFQAWSTQPAASIAGPVQYGDGMGGNLDGCAPFFGGSLTGKIVLVDRGTCFFSTKIQNVEVGGGLVGIIGLVAPGAPFAGAFGGGPLPQIPGYMISQADADAIKAQIGGGPAVATVDPAHQLPLAGQMVDTSSRGPRNSDSHIKPEIGAPGASVSAEVGTGTGMTAFGGTSGATPMVAGAAALLLDAYGRDKGHHYGHENGHHFGYGHHKKKPGKPKLSPLEIKALLMNTADIFIDSDPFTGLAPVSRIGGGEVRVDDALLSDAVARDWQTGQGALSFGFMDVSKETVHAVKWLKVRNLSRRWLRYHVTPTFRFGDDVTNGAVDVRVWPKTLRIRPNGTAWVWVKLTIDGEMLRPNFMSSGDDGANPDALTLNEYDGYLILDDGHRSLNVPWHVLPRKAARVFAHDKRFAPGGFPSSVGLFNRGVGTAQIDSYSLIATSPDLPEGGRGELSPTPDIRAVGVNTFPVPEGFCSDSESFVWAFAINSWERQTHLVPVSYSLFLDTDQDGDDEVEVFNFDASLSTSLADGRQVTFALNGDTGELSAFFFTEHATNTGNTALYVCAEQLGLSAADMLTTNVNVSVSAFDWYYGGPGDSVGGLTVTPLGERYFGLPSDIPGMSAGGIDIYDFGPWPGNSPELGVLLFTNGDRGPGAHGGATRKTEAKVIGVEGADLDDLGHSGHRHHGSHWYHDEEDDD